MVSTMKTAKFAIGQVVRHRLFPFRGIIFDVDPQFANTEEWYESIPAEVRPCRDQPFYHLLAENSETEYIAYVSEQNLLEDDSGEPVRHPQVREFFEKRSDGIVEEPSTEERPAAVIDLMEALRASVEEAKKKAGGKDDADEDESATG